ncbi:enoyl-CoA hydratase/isomerase family protein [Pseudomonas typographi]|uniref:enoyl-CoA hydratase/isomerase family protein n=1 Tax=Pseudomonas typographi TaxID=2715964 RepID=UPI001687D2DE|nr:enoyl-CoA hydratase/isomerase family protein [Pseudomonas typographi]MBD1551526.1 enoyl-CoA hydratase/isomerase family protein [Pseudomonas typographi]
MTDTDTPVLAAVHNKVGYLTLNRPAKLNTLDLSMIRRLHRQLQAWEHDPQVLVVVVGAAGGKSFCAGGDIRALYDSYLCGDGQHLRFFEEEYALDQHIHRYRKPIMALMDGLVLGGGLGLVQGATLRVITERSRLGMPEVAIGYFPDVGASFFLPRLPGELGIYLAVTGQQVQAADALYAGLADVCIPSAQLGELRRQLDTQVWSADPAEDLKSMVAPLSTTPAPGPLETFRSAIDNCFALPNVAAIHAGLLAATQPEHKAWAKDTAALLNVRSPLAMSVTLALMRWGRSHSLEQCFAMELFLDRQWFAAGDIIEGIRALIVDKDNNPKWQPASLQAINAEQVQAFFANFGQ